MAVSIHLSMATMPTTGEIVGIIRILGGVIVGCTLADPWKHLASRLLAMTMITEDEGHGDVDLEVRASGDGWTVYGIVPVFSSPSRFRARKMAARIRAGATDGEIQSHGHALAVGGVSSYLRSMELTSGDDVRVGVFRLG